MVSCPECGSTGFRVGRMCPKHQEKAVCSACCKLCEYWTGERCNWHLFNDSGIEFEKEKEKLRNKIAWKEAQSRRAYEKDHPALGEKLFYEAKALRRQLTEMEKER